MRAAAGILVLVLGLFGACGESSDANSAGTTDGSGGAGTSTSGNGGAAVSAVMVSNIAATSVSSTGFDSTSGGAAGAPATSTTGYIDDCQSRVTSRDDTCYLHYLCDGEATLGDCNAWDDDVWRCGCNQPDQYFHFEVAGSDAQAACSSLEDWCLEGDGPVETGGERSCGLEEDELYTSGTECYAVVACRKDAELDGMEVRAVEWANLSCYYSFEQEQWDCDCYFQGAGAEFVIESPPDREVDDDLAEAICIQAAPQCPGG